MSPIADHPLTDPGDGRQECETCGKWVFPVIHSCKGVPVTEAAWQRWAERQATVAEQERTQHAELRAKLEALADDLSQRDDMQPWGAAEMIREVLSGEYDPREA